jgi:hypothetical protein
MATMTVFDTAIPSPLPMYEDWRSAYQAALFEHDRSLLRQKIKQAEAVIKQRERYLFSNPSDTTERQSLIQALHSLRALWMCLEL